MSLAQYANAAFSDEYTLKLDKEWTELCSAWQDTFGTEFPGWHLVDSMQHKDVYKVIKRSLKTGKDYATPEIEKHPFDESTYTIPDGCVW